ncbi:RHS repeat-associated core domain-containing protein [Cysteiniphilum sp. QT6929]|uniref:RHS repeat domain-containing protein n=1 Tax=Cysteiniphilum sp. QT6929 TaxID=2975055 RepID=UPI0024B32A49|nr:RHS repeat-associated core domain-containing protein [Cysteiniphilum sp. QT6929]WHN66491.1 RHS repeat-associated core domain-containing protein [Cysteiniphilum sp. QT6929]
MKRFIILNIFLYCFVAFSYAQAQSNTSLEQENVQKTLKEELKSDQSSPNSNAYNFASGQVNQRSGSYQYKKAVAGMLVADKESFQLDLNYNSSSRKNYGYGEGWSFNLTHYDKDSKKLYLSDGGALLEIDRQNVAQGSQYYRKHDIQLVQDDNNPEYFFIIYKNGIIEHVAHNGLMDKRYYADGSALEFHYEDGIQSAKVKSIYSLKPNGDYGHTAIKVSYSNQSVIIDSIYYADVKSRESETKYRNVKLNLADGEDDNKHLVSIIDASDSEISQEYKFEYNPQGGTCSSASPGMSKIIYPTGVYERLTYKSLEITGTKPTKDQVNTICVIDEHGIYSAKGEEIIKPTYYAYNSDKNTNNFSGYPVVEATEFGFHGDKLADLKGNFTYEVSQRTPLNKNKQTYNKFHLSLSEELYSDELVLLKEVRNEYGNIADLEAPISNMPANYDMPTKTTTIIHGKTKDSKKLITYQSYDEYGNLIKEVDSYGRMRLISYYSTEARNSLGYLTINDQLLEFNFSRYPQYELILPSKTNGNKTTDQTILVKKFTYKILMNEGAGFVVQDTLKEGHISEYDIDSIDYNKNIQDATEIIEKIVGDNEAKVIYTAKSSWAYFDADNYTNTSLFGLKKGKTTENLDSQIIDGPQTVKELYEYDFDAVLFDQKNVIPVKKISQMSGNVSKKGENSRLKRSKYISLYDNKDIAIEDSFGNIEYKEYDDLGRLTDHYFYPKGDQDDSKRMVNKYIYCDVKKTNNACVEGEISIIEISDSPDGQSYRVKTVYNGIGQEIAQYVDDLDGEGKPTSEFFKINDTHYSNDGLVDYVRGYDKGSYSDGALFTFENKQCFYYDEFNDESMTLDLNTGLIKVIERDLMKNEIKQYAVNINRQQKPNDDCPDITDLNLEGEKTEISYSKTDDDGNVLVSYVENPDKSIGTKVESAYDQMGRIYQTTSALGGVVTYNYNQKGQVIKKLMPNKTKLISKHDFLGNETMISIAEIDKKDDEAYLLGKRSFNALGQLLSIENVEGYKKENTYTEYGDVDSILNEFNTPFVIKRDEKTNQVNCSYIGDKVKGTDCLSLQFATAYTKDKKTNINKTTEDKTGKYEYFYSSNKRLVKVEFTPKFGTSSGQTLTAEYNYSLNGQLLSFKDYQNNRYSYYYNSLHQKIEKIKLELSNGSQNNEYMQFNYDDPFYRVTDVKLNDGNISVTRSIDYRKLPQSLTLTNKVGSDKTQLLKYTFTNKDNYYSGTVSKKERIDSINGQTQSSDESYQYDDIGNLSAYNCSGGLCPADTLGKIIKAQVYTFDRFNNIATVTQDTLDGESNTTTYYYKESDPTRLSYYENSNSKYGVRSQNIQYNEAGSIVKDDQGNHLTYNELGQLVQYQGNETVRYAYDAQGKQIMQQVNNQDPVYMYYLGDQLIHESQGDRWLTYLQSLEGTIGQLMPNGERIYHLQDIAGSILLSFKVNTKNESELVSQRSYSPYGVVKEFYLQDVFTRQLNDITKLHIGYNGIRTDYVTKYQYLGNGYRAYNPVLKRFMQYDSMSPFDKGGINGYSYALNNPIMYKDPSGHFGIAALAISILITAVTTTVNAMQVAKATGDSGKIVGAIMLSIAMSAGGIALNATAPFVGALIGNMIIDGIERMVIAGPMIGAPADWRNFLSGAANALMSVPITKSASKIGGKRSYNLRDAENAASEGSASGNKIKGISNSAPIVSVVRGGAIWGVASIVPTLVSGEEYEAKSLVMTAIINFIAAGLFESSVSLGMMTKSVKKMNSKLKRSSLTIVQAGGGMLRSVAFNLGLQVANMADGNEFNVNEFVAGTVLYGITAMALDANKALRTSIGKPFRRSIGNTSAYGVGFVVETGYYTWTNLLVFDYMNIWLDEWS